MIRTVIVSAFRNIFRNLSFSIINLVGLGLSMSLALLIIVIIKGQYSFDRNHADSDRIYRINTEAIRTNGDREGYASVPLAVVAELESGYAFDEEVVKLQRQFNGVVKNGFTQLPLRGLFADQSFLNVFNFPLNKGDHHSALLQPRAVVLTEPAARRLFGAEEAIGKTIELGSYGEFTVTGILAPITQPTHFEFEALASFSTLAQLENTGMIQSSQNDWLDYYNGYAYIKLKPGVSSVDVEQALAEIVSREYTTLRLETRDKGYRFYLQSLGDITPGPALSNNMGRGVPEMLLIFLAVLAGIVMIMACFNYTQLTVAKSLTRAKEVGIRKIAGAHRFQVFLQLVGEAVFFSFIALGFAYVLLQIIKPAFQQLHLHSEFQIDLSEDLYVIIMFVAFAILTGTLAGLLPAGYLSAFRPLQVLKNAGNPRIYSRMTFRKALMVTQFTLSLVFIFMIITVYRQVNFMITADYGIAESEIMNIPLQGNSFEKLANLVRNVPGVTRVAGISHRMGTWADGSSDYKRRPGDELFRIRDFSVDENFMTNIQARFVAGRNFRAGEENSVILNQKALQSFGFADPHGAIGETIYLGDSTELVVRGVVEDFNFRPLSYAIGPLALRYDIENLQLLSVKIAGDKSLLAAKIESVWKKIDTQDFTWAMMEDEIDQAYESAGLKDMISIVGYITVIAITLSCLGMLGMVVYTTETRIKEIGVRKILGAEVKDVLFLLSRSFVAMVIIAVVIGTPISLLLGNFFLESYAYKVPFSLPSILLGIVSVVTVTASIIGSQTWRAATANPVNALRNE